MSKTYTNPETIGLHAGWRKDENTNSVAVPIHQTTSFQFDDTEHAANLFSLAEPGFIYTRLNNPTNDVLEQRLAALEGGVAAVATASGTAAIATTLMVILKNGDHIVASSSLYGGTYNLLKVTLPRLGITTTFVNADNPDNFKKAVKDFDSSAVIFLSFEYVSTNSCNFFVFIVFIIYGFCEFSGLLDLWDFGLLGCVEI